MRLRPFLLATLCALPFAAPAAVAQSPLATVFSSWLAGAVSNHQHFDLTVHTPAITITGMDLNLVGTGTVSLYTRVGTRLGHQNNPAGWTLRATVPVTNAQAGVPTPLSFAPIALGAGVNGIAVHISGAMNQVVTHQSFTPPTVSTAEVTLDSGEGTSTPFSGSVSPGWVVNTNIRYLVGDLVGLPGHANVYINYSRGFNFTAATDFVIRQLDLPPEAKQAGDTASYLLRVNGAVAFRSVGNSGPVAPDLRIHVGDAVDVIGNWSPAAANMASAHNSYTGSVAPYAATILGVPHTLHRCGWQWDIGAANWTASGATGTYFGGDVGQLGRVLMAVEPPVGASNTVLGQGCGAQFSSIYEVLTPANFDLANSAVRFAPTPTGHTITRNGGLLPTGSVATPVALSLTDDSQVTVPFTTGSFPGWSALTICSNGFVSAGNGNGTDYAPVVATMLAAPQTAYWAWHDYNPASPGSGQVKVEQSPAVTVITWDGVFTYQDPTPTTLQFQLYASGQVVIAFGSVSPNTTRPHLIGYSPGGASNDPGPFDYSALGASGVAWTQIPEAPALALTATSLPVVGASWNLQLDNVPSATAFGVDILGLSDPGIPDLAFLGMPGCQLRASLDSMSVWIHGGGSTHAFSLGVPPLALLGVSVYAASATFSTQPVNAFGAVISNGVRGTIGNN